MTWVGFGEYHSYLEKAMKFWNDKKVGFQTTLDDFTLYLFGTLGNNKFENQFYRQKARETIRSVRMRTRLNIYSIKNRKGKNFYTLLGEKEDYKQVIRKLITVKDGAEHTASRLEIESNINPKQSSEIKELSKVENLKEKVKSL